MPVKILMPALSPTMKSGTIAKWLKNEGDAVGPGDILADIETDKAVMEFEYADEPGVLYKIFKAEGSQNVAVNSVIAVVQVGDEDMASVVASCGSSADAPEATTQPDVTPQAEPVVGAVKQADNATVSEAPAMCAQTATATCATKGTDGPAGGRVKASPLARKIAADLAIDLSTISGSGPYGRIVKDDVLAVADAPKTGSLQVLETGVSTGDVVTEVSSMRRVIAERLSASKSTVPHFYLSADCNISELLHLRAKINADAEEKGIKITVNDFVIKAVALAMKTFPEINSSWLDGKIVRYQNVDVSFAVSIDEGLITPVIRSADTLSLHELSAIAKSLASRARDRKLLPQDFSGGGFTVSNMGMYGIKEFYAIINPPQSCIMAVGAAEKRPIVVDNCIVVADVMTVSLSVDHRVVDGALAAQFLKRFKSYMENPLSMLVLV